MSRLLIHFARFGPYHHARLRSAAEVLGPLGWEVIGLETAGNDSTYAWDPTGGPSAGPRVVTAFPGRVYEEITAAEYRQGLLPLLNELAPDAMAIAGWGSTDAQLCLSWCRKHDVRRIVMSETRAADGRRVWWKELVKRYLISRFDAALVGGKSHRDYLVSLGIPAERIAFGYNVVDNAYFAEAAEKWRRQETGDGGQGTGEALSVVSCRLSDEESVSSTSTIPNPRSTIPNPRSTIPNPKSTIHNPQSTAHCSLITDHFSPYFLASNRFIARKNLSRLIEAYASYIHSTSEIQHSTFKIWPLVLLGDGELRGELVAQCQSLGLAVAECAPWESGSGKAESGKLKAEIGEAESGKLKAEIGEDGKAESGKLKAEIGEAEDGKAEDGKAESGKLKAEIPSDYADRQPLTADRQQPTADSQQPTAHSQPPTANRPPPSDSRLPSPASRLPPPASRLPSPVSRLPSGPTVFFPGFRQIEELPRFYAHAGCFVHPALEEPWGLVLNEAMACGLPVLSGSNVGAAEELVDDRVNGWTFDAESASAISAKLAAVSGLSAGEWEAMAAASRRLLRERAALSAFGDGLAALLGRS